MGGLRPYFEIDFSGRLSRGRFWDLWHGARRVNVLPFLGLVGGGVAIIIANGRSSPALGAGAAVVAGLSVLTFAWLGFASMSRAVRRLHDFNRSGLILLTPLPCLALPLGVAMAGYTQVALACLILPLLAVYLNFNALGKPGDAGSNRYGPPQP